MSLKGFINKEKRNWAAKNEPTQIGKVCFYLEYHQSYMGPRHQRAKAKACNWYFK